jgi:hypothetical protein
MPREPFRALAVLTASAFMFLVTCEAGSVNVLEPSPSTAADASGDAFALDAPPSGDAEGEDGAPAPPDASGCVGPLAIGAACTASDACCSGLCALDPTSKLTCRPTTGCLGLTETCTFAGACCGLACVTSAIEGGGRTCVDAPLCGTAGAACRSAADCCSNVCSGSCVASAGCRPAGEACAGNGDCCGGVCATASDGLQRCALLQGCRVEGEICGGAGDCCTGSCVQGRCAALAACPGNDGPCTRQVGEVCNGDNDCCSRQCRVSGDGTSRCVPAGGCRSECELCSTDADCCSGSCAASPDGSKRCQAAGCGSDGETCNDNGHSCPGRPNACYQDPPAVGPHRCHLEAPDASCAAPGSSCALPSECCSGRCTNEDGAAFTCAASCVSDGAPCTARSDCCGAFSDCLVLEGALVCAPLIH